MRWPEALAIVHELWKELPDRYKYNHQLKRLEIEYENWDCSRQGGFEGVRAQEILPLLLKKFHFDLFVGFGNVIERVLFREHLPHAQCRHQNFIRRQQSIKSGARQAEIPHDSIQILLQPVGMYTPCRPSSTNPCIVKQVSCSQVSSLWFDGNPKFGIPIVAADAVIALAASQSPNRGMDCRFISIGSGNSRDLETGDCPNVAIRSPGFRIFRSLEVPHWMSTRSGSKATPVWSSALAPENGLLNLMRALFVPTSGTLVGAHAQIEQYPLRPCPR